MFCFVEFRTVSRHDDDDDDVMMTHSSKFNTEHVVRCSQSHCGSATQPLQFQDRKGDRRGTEGKDRGGQGLHPLESDTVFDTQCTFDLFSKKGNTKAQ